MNREVVTRHDRTFTVTVHNTVQMRKRQPRAVEFVKIPAVWTIKLRGQHGRVYDMAHHLLLLNFKSYKRGFKLTNVAMECLEMDRRVKREPRALVPHETLASLVDEMADRFGEAVALQRTTDDGLTRTSFAEVRASADAFAARLAARARAAHAA